jgi:UDP-N-acetylglucosamine 1-carboxyvinyltransferase
MSTSLLIEEGKIPLRGEYRLSPSVNTAAYLICASLLTPDRVQIDDVPESVTIKNLQDLLKFLGGRSEGSDEVSLRLTNEEITTLALPRRDRLDIHWLAVIAGALLARYGYCAIPNNLIDQLSGRELAKIFEQFQEYGVNIQHEDSYWTLRFNPQQPDANINIEHPYVIDVVVAVFLSILGSTNRRTVIRNAKISAEVRPLIDFLIKMGAKINHHANEMEITAVPNLKGGQVQNVADLTEARLVCVAAAVTHGDVSVKDISQDAMVGLLTKFHQIGINYQVSDDTLRVWSASSDNFQPISLQAGFSSSLTSEGLGFLSIFATQVEGETDVLESLRYQGIDYLKPIVHFGAEMKIENNQGIPDHTEVVPLVLGKNGTEHSYYMRIFGPTQLQGTQVVATDILSGMTYILAGMSAKGSTEIANFDLIHDVYPNLLGKLSKLGAKVKLLEV